ncbi:MAG: IclR family transcriptional regulator [Pseudorhodoplanes sp.]|uniref:IclR family transcriptional regulator n=1 Tax=Pseudorhodoplanes sp. TaxID=1934341 RepID=UPI003D0E7444
MTRLVKSAVRTIEILEYFAAQQSPACVTEIAENLRYPQSSTTFLLNTLLDLGYVEYDIATRRYRASERLMLLGLGIFSELTADRGVVPVMMELAEQTGLIVLIGTRRGIDVEYLRIVQPSSNGVPYNTRARRRRLTHSALGKTLLATLTDQEIGRIARRINAETADPGARIPVTKVMDEIRRVRAVGYATSETLIDNYTSLAMQLPGVRPERPIALGLSIPTRELPSRELHYVRLLRKKIGAIVRRQNS